MPSIREIVHQFETTTTRSGLIQAIQVATSSLGFECFSVTLRLVHIGGGAWRIVMSSMPREFLTWYEQEQIFEDDPLFRRSLESLSPFYSDELDAGAVARRPKAYEYLRAVERYGIGAMLSCAQPDHCGALTLATFGGARAGNGDRDEVREKGAWLVAHLHDALGRIVSSPVAARRGATALLTRIERSMLELLARGYGAREIAQLLAVSQRSVRYHAGRVREKLGARSLNQAVSRAIESRQITLSGSTLPAHWGGLVRVVFATSRESGWIVQRPTLEMALGEVRSASSFDTLAQAIRRAVAPAGFEHFAFVLRAPDAVGSQPLVLTNDPSVRGGPDGAGSLLHRSLTHRSYPHCVPRFWDECEGGTADPGAPTGITAAILAADGGRSCLSLAGSATGADRYEQRHACFRLARAAHERAHALLGTVRPRLTDSDRLALRQMTHGASIRKVAVQQQRKERTLRYRLTVVARKLGARNSRHALAIATERGLLDRDPGRLLSRELIRPFGAYSGSEA